MADDAQGLSPVSAFLAPLKLTQYRDVFVSSGYDDPSEFAKFNADDANEMKAALLNGGVLLGHVGKVMRDIQRLRQPSFRPSPPAGPSSADAPAAQTPLAAAGCGPAEADSSSMEPDADSYQAVQEAAARVGKAAAATRACEHAAKVCPAHTKRARTAHR